MASCYFSVGFTSLALWWFKVGAVYIVWRVVLGNDGYVGSSNVNSGINGCFGFIFMFLWDYSRYSLFSKRCVGSKCSTSFGHNADNAVFCILASSDCIFWHRGPSRSNGHHYLCDASCC